MHIDGVDTSLIELRRNRNLTQVQLGKAIKVSSSLISAYEKSDRLPSLDVLIRLSDFFHVSTDYILGCEPKTPLNLDGLSPKDKEAVLTIIESLKNNSGQH